MSGREDSNSRASEVGSLITGHNYADRNVSGKVRVNVAMSVGCVQYKISQCYTLVFLCSRGSLTCAIHTSNVCFLPQSIFNRQN